MKPSKPFILLFLSFMFACRCGFSQGTPPKCDPDEINFADVDPDDIYYQVLKKACEFMGAESYDSVRYYLEYAYSIKPSASFPATKRKELKEYLGEDEYNKKPRYTEGGQVPEVAAASKEPEKPNNGNDVQATDATAATTAPATSEDAEDKDAGKVTLTDEEQKEFKEKASQKAKDFGDNIKKIADKNSSMADINNSIELTVKLFVSENRTVQVSSLNSPDKPKYKIRKYLNRLSELNYANVKIETYDYYYASDFKLAPDGNYYATISFAQKFTGYNKENQPAYEDVTKKDITVVIKKFQKAVEGATKNIWEVYLSDISVSQAN